MNDIKNNSERLRLLVAIASFGEKNIEFLRRIISQYQSMAMDVDVVVVTEALKSLDSSIRQFVGLPTSNPWSLPFAHKKIFADNLDRYDLFAYSEDDMDVTEENIEAFFQITPFLESDEVAGFLRYEADSSGNFSLPEVHGTYHWKAETVKQRGPYTVAEFSNEHAAFYLLTQAQLRRAIASGGFLREPYISRYDMLCTAATDPYTVCGFRKVICVSSLKRFLIHHMSNRYAGSIGLSLAKMQDQIQMLERIRDGLHPAVTLGQSETKFLHSLWSKSYYEEACRQLLDIVPAEAKQVLSIGCGSGNLEAALLERGGIHVTALPLDSVIGLTAERRGIEVIYGTLEQGLRILGNRTFDCVVISNLLHLFPDVGRILDQFMPLVQEGGTMILRGPNFDFYKLWIKRTIGVGEMKLLRHFDRSGMSICGPTGSKKALRRLGFCIETTVWFDASSPKNGSSRNKSAFARWSARDWTMRARRNLASSES